MNRLQSLVARLPSQASMNGQLQVIVARLPPIDPRVLAACTAASVGVATWALLLRRRALRKCQVLAIELGRLREEAAMHYTEYQKLDGECQLAQAALTVALRREEARAMEVQRGEQLLHEEREALEEERQAIAARETQQSSRRAEHEQTRAASYAARIERQLQNAEKSKAIDKLGTELDALRNANKATGTPKSPPTTPTKTASAPATPTKTASAPGPAESRTPDDLAARRARAALDSAKRRARVRERIDERRALGAKMEEQQQMKG